MEFFDRYMEYVGETEAPTIFHRWVAIAMTGALFGRQVYLPFGSHDTIYPNQYIILTGSPGTRKGSAMKPGSALLKRLGYQFFAANKTSKEQLWVDMANQDPAGVKLGDDDDLDEFLDAVLDQPSQLFIEAPEFTDFMGAGNEEFIDNLTNMWDNLPEYKISYKNGSWLINKPTISLLGATTTAAIHESFNPSAIGKGFFSRVLFIYSPKTGKKIPFPEEISVEAARWVYDHMQQIKAELHGAFCLQGKARQLCSQIYTHFPGMHDTRFQFYGERRYTHMLKLIMILAVLEGRLEAWPEDVIRANTLLHIAELRMPYALGEFGKSIKAGAYQAVVEALQNANEPLSMEALYTLVQRDVANYNDFVRTMQDLAKAKKVQVSDVRGERYITAVHEVRNEWPDGLIDFGLVQPSENPDVLKEEDLI